MQSFGTSRVVALIFSVLLVSVAVADDPDLSVLVGKWQGRIEGLRGNNSRFLIIERIDGKIGYAQYGTPDKDIFPVQVDIRPDPDGSGRPIVEFYTPSNLGGNHMSVRLTPDGKALRGTFSAKGGGAKGAGKWQDVNLLRVTQ